MIYLPEVATKLQELLNGSDVSDLDFVVATEGFHLDYNYNQKAGRNFIPVFINSLGGTYDSVAGVKRSTQNIQVVLYFPVRFKDAFFAINDYLVDTFVAKMINYGNLTGTCLSNISVAQYGEIVDLDLRNFKTWTENTYKRAIDVMEPYMTMTFQLYLTTSAAGFIFGNDVEFTLSFTHNGVTYSQVLKWTSCGTGASNSPIAQQLIDVDSYAKNVINITNYNKSIMAYVENTPFWAKLLELYNNNQVNDLTALTLAKNYKNLGIGPFTYNQVVLSINENIALGDLVSFTITFGDLREEVE